MCSEINHCIPMKTEAITKPLIQWRGIRHWGMGAVLLTLLMMAGIARAQSLAYSNAIVALNPAGYWPMHEVEAAAPGDIETNYGSLGVLGNGYYPDYQINSGAFVRQLPGPLANGADTSVLFTEPVSDSGGATNSLFVPHTSPLTTLQAPFTIELWYMISNLPVAGFQGDFISQCNGNKDQGFRIYFQDAGTNSTVTGADILFYNTTTLNQGFQVNFGGAPTNQWHYMVVTVDTSDNVSTYLDGVLQTAAGTDPRQIPAGRYNPDFHDPLTIGNGLGNLRGFNGGIAEVAIYTNVISDIATHYSDATNVNSAANQYFNDVMADDPIIYLRMNSSPYAAPNPSTWPALLNYGQTNGTAVGNGVYTPGTAPGALTETAYTGAFFGLINTNMTPLSGVSSFADAGYASAYDPTGTTPFTVSAVFRGNPTDTNRVQTIVGHGTNSWELGLTQLGYLVFNSGTNSAAAVSTGSGAGDLVSTVNTYDNGNWHWVVAVHNGATNVLYVDGIANNTNVAGANNVGDSRDVMIGSDPCYTNTPIAWGGTVAQPLRLGAQFAGQISDVAFFTNALTAAQIQTLYNAIGAPITGVSTPVLSRVGGTDVYSITASGSSPGYQWYFNTTPSYSGATGLTDGGGVSGSATASVTIANLADYYFVVVTNLYSSMTSSIVQVPQLTALAAGEPIWNQASQTNVMVTFSTPLDPVSAGTAGNYTITGATVYSATVVASNEVALVTSALTPGTSYTLTIQNVENDFGAGLLPAPTILPIGLYPANLALWVKANTGVTVSPPGSDSVYSWNDLSGNNNTLTEVSGISPLLATNANGQPVIRFNSTNDTEMDAVTSPTLAITNDICIIGVINFATLVGGTNGEICSKTSAAHENIAAPYDYYVGTTAGLYRGNGNGTTAGSNYGVFSATIAPTVGIPQILAVSETGNTITHYVNGRPAGTGLLSSSYQETNDADAGQDFSIGARADQHNRLTGDISELIVAGSAISSYDVAELDSYLAAEYNVTLFNTNPTNIVFSTAGTNLNLSWPLDHTGWQLQAQTNGLSVGISTNWVNVTSSLTTNQLTIPINVTNGTVFYRLVYP